MMYSMIGNPMLNAYEATSDFAMKHSPLSDDTKAALLNIREANIGLARSLLTSYDEHAAQMKKAMKA